MLYHLNNSKSDGNECQDNSTSITYNNNSNYIELTNLSPHITTDSVLSKTLISGNAGTLSKIDLDKLYKEYFQPDMDDFSIFKMEKMFNDFRIVLKLIENLKENKTVNSK